MSVRSRITRLLVCVLALAGLCAAVAAASPAISKDGSSALLLVRLHGSRDDLVSVPTGGSQQVVGSLPGRAALAVTAPDGSAVAYLPAKTGASIWVASSSGLVRTVSLARRGVTVVDALTWVSPTRLVVSGLRKVRYVYPAKDYLYMVDLTTSKVASFRHLRGAEPSASVRAGKLVFVRIADAGPWPGMSGTRKMRERLLYVDLARGVPIRCKVNRHAGQEYLG